MRVALLSHNACAHDAVGNHVAETVAFFQERGAAVRVFVESADRLHPELRGCTEAIACVAAEGDAWAYLADADLVIAQFSQACGLLDFLPLLAGGKPRLVLDYHSVTPPKLWSGANREALHAGLAQRGLVWCVDAAIAHSEFARRELIAATGFPAERVHYLPLVVDTQRFQPGPDRWLQRRLGRDDIAVLLYVGRLAPNKRVPTLVEALAQLPPRVHAVVIGDAGDVYAAEAQRCLARAADLGVADRLHLLGQVSDTELAAAYRSAAVLVIPSRHEGCCVPVIEAMASGLPVVAARAAALPETVGDAGLTFTPDDAAGLAQQVRRVLACEPATRLTPDQRARVAIVCFRFGPAIVGGAEASLRTIAETLQSGGHTIEVFTTCTRSESDWRNELPAGTAICGGLTVHRFPIDPHDRAAHLASVRAITDGPAPVSPELEDAYLRHSVHSAALLHALQERADEFDAIIVGPYLFGLTADVAQALPERTLLLPCFHDEPIGRLACWPHIYGRVGGLLLHSPEEKELALRQLGVNNANVVEVGTCIDVVAASELAPKDDYVVYCGRYSAQKDLPLLLDWMRRYQQDRPGRLRLVCMGQGEVEVPREPWVADLGWVDEARKRQVLAGARALVQLSRQESLSLVALEAWAEGTPVIVHAGCAVLTGQVQRSQGGVAVADYDQFAAALDELGALPALRAQRGQRGRTFVAARYGARPAFQARLETALANLGVPLHERMRRRGLERARGWARPVGRETLARIVEDVLDQAPRPYQRDVAVQPLQDVMRAALDARFSLIAVRVHNRGTHAVAATGPGRTCLHAEVYDRRSGTRLGQETTDLPGLLIPGATQTAMLAVPVPRSPGVYDLRVGAAGAAPAHVALHVGPQPPGSPLAPLLDTVRQLVARAHRGQRLPDDYLDVTQGWCARAKRWLKKKLLHNFKHAYVDVLSRQQSHVNGQLVAAVQQLAECCVALEHNLQTMQRRLEAPRQSAGADAPRAEDAERSHA